MIIKFFNQFDQMWHLVDKVTDLKYQRDHKRISWAMKLYPSEKEFVSDTTKIFATGRYNPKMDSELKNEKTRFYLDNYEKETTFILIQQGPTSDEVDDVYHWWPDYASYCTSPNAYYNKDNCKPLLEITFKEDGVEKILLTDGAFPVYICNDKGDTIDKVGSK